MVRIRYTESNGTLTSKPMVAGDKLVISVIDTVNNNVSIKTTEGEVLANGTAVDVAVLKKKAKAFAVNLGVVFQDEVRRRGVEAQ